MPKLRLQCAVDYVRQTTRHYCGERIIGLWGFSRKAAGKQISLNKLLPPDHSLASLECNFAGMEPRAVRDFLRKAIRLWQIDNQKVISITFSTPESKKETRQTSEVVRNLRQKAFEKIGKDHYDPQYLALSFDGTMELVLERLKLYGFEIDETELYTRILASDRVNDTVDELIIIILGTTEVNIQEKALNGEFYEPETSTDKTLSAKIVAETLCNPEVAVERKAEVALRACEAAIFMGGNRPVYNWLEESIIIEVLNKDLKRRGIDHLIPLDSKPSQISQIYRARRAIPIVPSTDERDRQNLIKIIAQGLLAVPTFTTYGRDLEGCQTKSLCFSVRSSKYPELLFPVVPFDFILEFLTTSKAFNISLGDSKWINPLFTLNASVHYFGCQGFEQSDLIGGLDLIKRAGIEKEKINDRFIIEQFSSFVGVDPSKRIIAFPSIIESEGRFLYHGWGRNYQLRGMALSQDAQVQYFIDLKRRHGIYGTHGSRLSLSSDPMHSRRFGHIIFEVSIDKLIQEKTKEFKRFYSLLRKIKNPDEYKFYFDNEVWGICALSKSKKYRLIIENPLHLRIEMLEKTKEEDPEFLELVKISDALTIMSEHQACNLIGSPSKSLQRNIGYGEGTINSWELEVKSGFYPQFLPMSAIGTIFMPDSFFKALQQRGSIKIVDGQKYFPTLVGDKPITTYSGDIAETLCNIGRPQRKF